MVKQSRPLAILLLCLCFTSLGFKCDKNSSLAPETSSFLSYANQKHGFNLEYPLGWFLTSDSETDVVYLSSVNESLALGGPPSGVRMKIMVLNNPERFDLKDWVKWIKTEGPDLETVEEKEITVAGQKAIQQITDPSSGPIEQGPTISVYLPKDSQIIQINYLGREPAYSENKANFEVILKSFQFF